jgi:hypothetical protein
VTSPDESAPARAVNRPVSPSAVKYDESRSLYVKVVMATSAVASEAANARPAAARILVDML